MASLLSILNLLSFLRYQLDYFKEIKKDYMILKVYSFIYMQNKIVDLPKKALGDYRKKDKIFLKVTDFFNFQSNIIQIIE